MKKLIFTLLLIFAYTSASHAQKFSFRDAYAIDTSYQKEYYKNVLEVLVGYMPTKSQNETINIFEIINYYKDNIFIKKYIDNIEKYRNDLDTQLKSINTDLKNKIIGINDEESKLKRCLELTDSINNFKSKYYKYKDESDYLSQVPNLEKSISEIRTNYTFISTLTSLLIPDILKDTTKFNNNIKNIENDIDIYKKDIEVKLSIAIKNKETTVNASTTLLSDVKKIEEIKIAGKNEQKAPKEVKIPQPIKDKEPTTTSNNTIIIQPSGGASFQSNILDGAAKFIAERMKEEISIAFFDKFQNTLERTNLRTLFPQTTNIMVSTQSFNYTITIQVLKEAFEQDLNKILENIPAFIEKSNLIKNNEAVYYLGLLSKTINQLNKGTSSLGMLSFLVKEMKGKKDKGEFEGKLYKVLQASEMIAYSLQSSTKDTQWLTDAEFEKIQKGGILSDMFLGLVYEQVKQVLGIDLSTDWKTEITEAYSTYKSIENQITALRSKISKGEKATADDYLQITYSLVGSIENILNTQLVPQGFWGTAQQTLTQVQKLQTLAKDIYVSVQQRDYQAMATNVITLLVDMNVFSQENAIKNEVVLKDILNNVESLKKNINKKGYIDKINTALNNLDISNFNEAQKASMLKILSKIESINNNNISNAGINTSDLDDIIKYLSPLVKYNLSKTKDVIERIKDVYNQVIPLTNELKSISNITKKQEKAIEIFREIYALLTDEDLPIPISGGILTNANLRSFIQDKIKKSPILSEISEGEKDIIKEFVGVTMIDFVENGYKDSANVKNITKQILEFCLLRMSNSQVGASKEEFIKYVSFIIAIINAKDSDDMKKAIRSIALPTGSYSIKRKTRFNISLNAYPGLTVGRELLLGKGAFTKGIASLKSTWDGVKWRYNAGFTAPVGLSFNWGCRKKLTSTTIDKNQEIIQGKKNYKRLTGKSFSVFVSVIDLGALVLFRLQDDVSPLPQNVDFGQVFAPGVFGMYGLGKVPLTIFAGVQYSPKLRSVKVDNIVVNDIDAIRFNVGLTIDIPILNLHTKTK